MSYSPFHKISRHDKGAEIITVKESETVIIKGHTYRKAMIYGMNPQVEIDHYIIDQASLNKPYVSRNWYVQVKPHKCVWNCIDSGQADEEWIQHLRSPEADKRNVRNALKLMERYGYHNNPTKGDRKVG